MAAHKPTRSRKQDTSDFLRFPQVKGKIVESIDIDPHVEAITILFQDKTVLSFDLEPQLAVFPEMSGWKSGNWRKIKRWRPVHSRVSTVFWP